MHLEVHPASRFEARACTPSRRAKRKIQWGCCSDMSTLLVTSMWQTIFCAFAIVLAPESQSPNIIDQRSLMFYATTTRKCLPRIFVLPSFRHIADTKNPCVLVLTRCHVTDINHVLTPCHVIEINYVDRGVAARTPL